jgi:ParB-like chromosome segregation protein Spo0J
MKVHTTLLLLTTLAAPLAQAMSIDPKALARFDRGYTVCEAKNPAMKGLRDEAYLSLWKVKADSKARAELAAARKTAAYRNEQAAVKKRDASGAAPPASSPIEQQCQALWAETQGTAKKKP